MHPSLRALHRDAARLGAAIPDGVFTTVSCKRCNRFVDLPHAETVDGASYRDLDGLERTARDWAQRLFAAPAVCPGCAGKAHPVAVDYHAHHLAMGRDLVIRVHKRLFTLECERLWWSQTTGHEAAGPLGEKQRYGIRRDACFRQLHAIVERAGIRAALPVVEEAVQSFRGDPALLPYASQLLGAGRADLVAQLAAVHAARHPEDPAGVFWQALAIVDRVNRRDLPDSALAVAETHLKQALALDPDFAEADCALCAVARLRGDLAGARACFERALERHPGDAATPRLLHDLAALELGRDPERALLHFERAEALEPGDPDFVLGRARALVQLGRLEEAEEALARGRALAPGHPRLREAEQGLHRQAALRATRPAPPRLTVG